MILKIINNKTYSTRHHPSPNVNHNQSREPHHPNYQLIQMMEIEVKNMIQNKNKSKFMIAKTPKIIFLINHHLINTIIIIKLISLIINKMIIIILNRVTHHQSQLIIE